MATWFVEDDFAPDGIIIPLLACYIDQASYVQRRAIWKGGVGSATKLLNEWERMEKYYRELENFPQIKFEHRKYFNGPKILLERAVVGAFLRDREKLLDFVSKHGGQL
jgi:hypothetical protein